MTEDQIACLLQMQESEAEEEAELPELVRLPKAMARSSDAMAAETGRAASPGEREQIPVPAAGMLPMEEASEWADGTEQQNQVLIRRLYQSLVQAQTSLRAIFTPSVPGETAGAAASALAGHMAAGVSYESAGPSVSFHLDHLDARTMDEWFCRDTRRYDGTDLK